MSNHDVISIQNLFIEEKKLSLKKVLVSVLYSQMQAKYLFSYFVLNLLNILYIKYHPVKYLLVNIASSITFGLITSYFLF